MIKLRRQPILLFSGFWLVGVALMTQSYVRHPVDPALHGTAAYGTTYAGELRFILSVTAVEMLISAMILRPWSYYHSWVRALSVFVLCTPWMLLWGALGLHAGPATHVHSIWLLLYWVGLLVSATVSGSVAAQARRASAEHAA
jgi:hypothetical protein